jgi:type IV pilus assembly protein PilW
MSALRVETIRLRAVARQHGVTLIETMIGMLIGMLAVLIISQVLMTSEGQKRTATGGSDAQVNGTLALYALQRDIEQAGYGLTSTPDILGCPISARYNGASPTGFPAILAPVVITAGAGSAPDSIRVLSSSTDAVSVPTRVMGAYAAGDLLFNTRSTIGFSVGDLALVAFDSVSPCWVFKVTGTAPRELARGNDDWNAAGMPNVAYAAGSTMVNLGSLVDNRYEIVDNTLRVSTFDFANPNTRTVADLQSDIVQLRFFYGRDTSAGALTDGVIDVFDTNTPTTPQGWQKVLAIRAIAVARSATYEKDEVTTGNPAWSVGTSPPVTGAATCAAGSCLTLDVGAGNAGSDARHYRYKVFDTVIPLRNLLWRSV